MCLILCKWGTTGQGSIQSTATACKYIVFDIHAGQVHRGLSSGLLQTIGFGTWRNYPACMCYTPSYIHTIASCAKINRDPISLRSDPKKNFFRNRTVVFLKAAISHVDTVHMAKESLRTEFDFACSISRGLQSSATVSGIAGPEEAITATWSPTHPATGGSLSHPPIHSTSLQWKSSTVDCKCSGIHACVYPVLK